jgi:hypothetical protein
MCLKNTRKSIVWNKLGLELIKKTFSFSFYAIEYRANNKQRMLLILEDHTDIEFNLKNCLS